MNKRCGGRVTQRIIWVATFCLVLIAAGLGAAQVCLAQDAPAKAAGFTLSSPAFVDGGALPVEFTCDGQRASPPLDWAHAPAGTQSYAVTMHHIPGPGDKHVYLVVYNIPANVHGLAKNGKDVGTFGINTVNGQQEYTPPCSKGPGPKKYTITAYALSAAPKMDGPADAITMDALLAAIKNTTLATAVMNVTVDRTGKVPGRVGADGADNQPPGPPPDGQDPPDQAGPPGGQPDQNGPPKRDGGGPPELRAALDALTLTADQKARITPLLQDLHKKQEQARTDFLTQLKTILDAAQYQKVAAAFNHRPGPPPEQGQGDGQDNPPPPPPPAPEDQPQDGAGAPHANAAPTAPQPVAALAAGQIAVTISGGHETDPRDHGRPVVLVAAALNVPSEVFHQAFSKVKPAGPGQEPEPAQVRLNKQALMDALGPYGVTNERLDEVSNYYRYSSSRGQMWRNTPATAYATVANGVVTVTITNAGTGYSSPPKISIAGLPNVTATAKLAFTTDFKTNGSIKEITVSGK